MVKDDKCWIVENGNRVTQADFIIQWKSLFDPVGFMSGASGSQASVI